MEQLHINCTMTTEQPNALGGTFVFFSTRRPTLKKSKRATKQPHKDTATMDGQSTTEREQRRHNSGLAKKRVSCFYDTFMVKQTFVLLINFSANNPLLRQAAKRYLKPARRETQKPTLDTKLHI